VLHFGARNWKRLRAYITGSVDEDLRLRNRVLSKNSAHMERLTGILLRDGSN